MLLPSLLKQTKKPNLGESLAQAFKLLDSSQYFQKITRFCSFPDEPQFWKYEVKFFSKKDKKKLRYSGSDCLCF